MAVMGTDGKRYHSASRAKRHEEVAAQKNNVSPMKKPGSESGAPASPHGAGEVQDLSNMDMKEVVAKHGPAHKVEVEHDHAGGKHHVTSHHKGGHHKSTHGSADEAHMAGAKAAGVQTPDTQDEGAEAEPFAGTESPEEETAEAGAIPGVR